MIAVVMSIILSIIGDFLSTAQKHNRQNFEHNRLEPICDLLMNHFMTNYSFANEQHGFTHCQSRTTQLLVALEKWSETLDQGWMLCGCHYFIKRP